MFEDEVCLYENGHLNIKDGVKYLNNTLWDNLQDNLWNYDITSVSLPDSLEYIDLGFFSFVKICDIILPDSIATIESKTFYSCVHLKSIKVSSGLKNIGYKAFYNCISLKKIILPNNLFRISDECFIECESLSEISIPNSVDYIGTSVFYNCTKLKKIIVPRRLVERYGEDYIRCNTNAEVIPNDDPIVKVDEEPKEVVVASEVVEKSTSIKCYNGVIKKSLLSGRKNQTKGFSGNFKK